MHNDSDANRFLCHQFSPSGQAGGIHGLRYEGLAIAKTMAAPFSALPMNASDSCKFQGLHENG
jgi:hypothetical protein